MALQNDAKPDKELWEEFERKFEKSRRWQMLFTGDARLIKWDLSPLVTDKEYHHPLREFYESPDWDFLQEISEDVFTEEGACVPALQDDDFLDVFRICKQAPRIPRFLLAGARKAYRLDPANLRVGILTAGGSAPGLNAVIDSITKRHFLLGTEHCKQNNIQLTQEEGYPPNLKILGYRGGYYGLLNATETEKDKTGKDKRIWVEELHPRKTDAWAATGGCKLQNLRTPEYKEGEKELDEFIEKLVAQIRDDELDILYCIGGNGTMFIANLICEKIAKTEGKKCIVVVGPKTMDNDVRFTDATFGFRTTVENAISVIRTFHSEAETLRRVGIIELFGAGSGFVALHASYASGEVDYVLIPETMGETVGEAQAELNRAVKRIRERAEEKGHALLVVAEGATLKAQAVIHALKRRPKIESCIEELEHLLRELEITPSTEREELKQLEALRTRVSGIPEKPLDLEKKLETFRQGIHAQKEEAFNDLVGYFKENLRGCHKTHGVFAIQPRHLIRGTPPNSFDLDLCKYTGKLMVDTALAGYTQCAVNLWQGRYVLVPLATAIERLKQVDVSGYYFISMMEKYFIRKS